MTTRCQMLGCALLFGCACAVVAQTVAQPKPSPPASERPQSGSRAKTCASPAKYRTVAETAGSSAAGSKYALAVDQDSRVLLLLTGKDGKVGDAELLGYEPALPADFLFSASLPKDHALLTLRRCSCSEPWRLWVALTVGFGEMVAPKLTLSNSLFVFRQGKDADDRTTLVTETFPEGAELTVDDINNDQATEIVVQYSPKFTASAAPAARAGAKFSSLLKMWRIDGDGRLQAVSLDNVINDIPGTASAAEMWLADYRHTEDVLYTEQRVAGAKGTTVIRRNYDWDDAAQRYALRNVVKTQEIAIK